MKIFPQKPAPRQPTRAASAPNDGFVLAAQGVTKVYHGHQRHKQDDMEPAVADATLGVRTGECLGIVGETGSGKTTLANCLAGLMNPTAGTVVFHGRVVNSPGQKPSVPRVRGVQVVMQDPGSSLNPRRTVESVLSEILRVHHLRAPAEVTSRTLELLRQVGLHPGVARSRPHRLSGGQQQRVAIARALAFEPEVVVADEIVSALDASVQAQILNLLRDLQQGLGLAVVLITHDMAVARHMCERLAVMYRGRVVESAETPAIMNAPVHGYTRSLLAAVPRLAPSEPQPGNPTVAPS
jgi:ABC-type glutathione transport system ATPase component